VTFTVASTSEALVKLRDEGVTVIPESEIGSYPPFACFASKVVPSHDGQSIFVLDMDLNILRLINKE
jgi:hypothetical protein